MKSLNRRGQNLAEYAILFGLVIGAFLTIQVYAKRGLQARVRSATDAATSISTDLGPVGSGTDTDTLNTTFKSQNQYEPYYAESTAQTYQENIKQQKMDSKTKSIIEEIVSDVSARASGAKQLQKGARVGEKGGADRTKADALWEEPTATRRPSGVPR